MAEIITVQVSGFEMDVIKFGSGRENFVIVPGMSLTSVIPSAGFIEAAYKSFTEKYTVYVPDRRRNLPDDYSVFDMARDTAEALQTLGVEEADFFGASQGGMIVQVIAAKYPALARKIVLGSTASYPNATSRRVMEKWKSLAASGDIPSLNREVFRTIYSERYYEKNERAFRLLENVGTKEDLRRFLILAEATERFDAGDALSFVKCPSLVIGAEDDRVLSVDASYDTAARLGDTPYIYNNYGHAVYDEAPDYKDRLLCFLTEN